MKKFLYFIGLMLYGFGVLGGFCLALSVEGAWPLAILTLFLAFMAWPKAIEWYQNLWV